MTKQVINVGTTANDKKGDSLRAAFQKVNANFTELYTALGLATDVNLNLGNFVFTDNTLSLTNTDGDDSTATQIEIAQPVRVESNLTVGGDILPNGNLTSNLGSPTQQWSSLYVSNNTIYINNVPIALDEVNNLTVNGTAVNAVGSADWTAITNKPSILSGDDVIGFVTSDTITEEIPGGVVSQTTSYQNQIIIDTTDAIRIANVLSQTVNDGVTTATDSTGSTIDVDGYGVYIKRYVEPDGPNNSSYFQVSTTNSGAVLEGVQEELVGNTYGRVTANQGTVVINTAAGGIDKQWGFDSDGNLTVPGSIIFPGNTARVYGNTDIVGLLANPNIGAGLEIAAGSTVNLYNEGNVIISANVNQVSGQKDWTFRSDGSISLPGNTTRTIAPASVNVPGATSTVVYSVGNWMTSIKLVIAVEGQLDGDVTNTPHTQTCEATIAASYNSAADPSMSVYGVVYTSPTPLATFTVATVNNNIEVTAVNSQTTNALNIRVQAIQFVSRYD